MAARGARFPIVEATICSLGSLAESRNDCRSGTGVGPWRLRSGNARGGLTRRLWRGCGGHHLDDSRDSVCEGERVVFCYMLQLPSFTRGKNPQDLTAPLHPKIESRPPPPHGPARQFVFSFVPILRSKPEPQLRRSGQNPPPPAIALKLDPGRSVSPDGPTPPSISAFFQIRSVRRCPWCSPVFHDGQKRAFSRVETLQNRKTEGRKSNPGGAAAFHGHHGTRPRPSARVQPPSSVVCRGHRRAKKRAVKTELATHLSSPRSVPPQSRLRIGIKRQLKIPKHGSAPVIGSAIINLVALADQIHGDKIAVDEAHQFERIKLGALKNPFTMPKSLPNPCCRYGRGESLRIRS